MTKEEEKRAAADAIIEASKDWPEMFPRSSVPKMTGGVFSAGYLANLDCRGEGPEGSFRAGRKKIYRKPNFIKWFINRLEV